MNKNFTTGLTYVVAGVFAGLIVFLAYKGIARSTSAEVTADVSTILGGIIGAIGAALAVILALRWQRADEAIQVLNVVKKELVEFGRLATAHLDTCEKIASGKLAISYSILPQIMTMPDPIVYPAVADKLYRTSSSQRIVSFFTRLSEAKSIVSTLANSPIAEKLADATDIRPLAECWLAIVQIARDALIGTGPSDFLDQNYDQEIAKMLDRAIVDARQAFSLESQQGS